jgi:hypothetical protein
MSLITFRDKNTSGDPVGPTWYLEFDALTVEEVSRSAEVTQYPIETGAMLSDHYQPLPREISLTGVVTDTPSGPWTNIEGMQNAAAPPVMTEQPLKLTVRPSANRVGASGVLRPLSTSFLPGRRVIQSNVERARLYIPKWAVTLQKTGSSFGASGVTRIASFASILDGLMSTKTSVNVILETGAEYVNMMITEHRVPRVSGRGGSVTVSIDMQEIVQADAAVTAAPIRSEPSRKSRKHTGAKSKKPVNRLGGGVDAARIKALSQSLAGGV